jgi:uncharacterized protein
MLINLLEIPAEGKLYICNQKTGDLNADLRDLIGKTPYQTEFTIRPLQAGTFELTGFIKTSLHEDCSRCGIDFELAVDQKIKEMLIPEQELPRNSKFAKANHVSDMHNDGPSVYEYQGHHFNAGEYFHEIVAMSEPYTPAPACTSDGNCSVCKKPVSDEKFSYEDPGFEEPVSPFADLKNIKLN